MSEGFMRNHPSARKDSHMVSTEVYNLVREIAGGPERPVKQAINRAVARIQPFLKLGASRVEDLWYGEARLIRAEEIDALRAAAAERRRKIEAGRAAAQDIANGYRAIAEKLRSIDPDFYCAEVLRLELAARGLGALDSAGTPPNPAVGPPSSGESGRS